MASDGRKIRETMGDNETRWHRQRQSDLEAQTQRQNPDATAEEDRPQRACIVNRQYAKNLGQSQGISSLTISMDGGLNGPWESVRES